MKRSITLLLSCLLLYVHVAAQQAPQLSCGQKELTEQLFRTNPAIKALHEQIEDRLRTYRLAARSGAGNPLRVNAIVTLPVVVHIIHNNGPENISDAQVLTAIQHLNEAYANTGYYDPSDGVNTQIQFCLAQRDPNNNPTNGITRDVSPYTNMGGTSPTTDDLNVKNVNRWNPYCYINIWVVKNIPDPVAGYAYLPSAHGSDVDGIVVEADFFGTSYAYDVVLTHEMGHYLGLYHTFEGGCTNNDCTSDGDKVCDTPPDQSTASIACNQVMNSCSTDALSGFTTDRNDLTTDYMDYGNLNCMKVFTQGQADRMNWFVQNVLQSLLNCKSCSPPCPAPVTAGFTLPAAPVMAGVPVAFTNTSVNATGYEWYVNGVLQSTSVNFTYSFPAVGSYTVRMVAQSGNALCNDTAQTSILQAVCPVTASFTKSAASVSAGTTIGFTNTSANATGYEWFVNGISQSTAAAFAYTSPTAGKYAVKLVAKNAAVNCNAVFTDTVEYTCAAVTAGFAPLTDTIGTGGNINFTNSSAGATTYQWAVNGSVVSTGLNYDFSPPGAGSYTITLTAGNGTCNSVQTGYINVTDPSDTCGSLSFHKTLSANGDDVAADVKETAPGDYIIAGYTNSFTSAANYDGLLIKMDKKGQVKWSETTGSSDNEVFNKVVIAGDGNYVAAGIKTTGTDLGWGSVFMTKADDNGNILWQKTQLMNSVPAGMNTLSDFIATSDGGFAFCGSLGTINTRNNIYVAKANSTGDIVWVTNINDNSFSSYVVQYKDTLLVFYQTVTGSSAYLSHLVRLRAADGAYIDMKTYGSAAQGLYVLFNKPTLVNDRIVISGSTMDNSNVSRPAKFELSPDGQLLRTTYIYSSVPAFAGSNANTLSQDGAIYMASGTTLGIFAGQLSDNGNFDWQYKYNTWTYFGSIQHTGNKDIIAAGSFRDNVFVNNNRNIGILKIKSTGSVGNCDREPGDGYTSFVNVPFAADLTTTAALGFTPATLQYAPKNVQFTDQMLCADTTPCLAPSAADSCNANTFQKTIGGAKSDLALQADVDAKGNYIISGITNSVGPASINGMVLKLNPAGKIVWSKALGNAQVNRIYSGKATSDGGSIHAGAVEETSGSISMILYKLDSLGNLQWAKKYQGPQSYARRLNVLPTSDGGYLASGNYPGNPGYVLLFKTDNLGNITWSKTYLQQLNLQIGDQNTCEGADAFVVSVLSYVGTQFKGNIFAVDKRTGAILWANYYNVVNTWGNSGRIYPYHDNYIVGMYYEDMSTGVFHHGFMYINSQGKPVGAYRTDDPYLSSALLVSDVSVMDDGNICYFDYELGAASQQYAALIKLTPDGHLLYAKKYILPNTPTLQSLQKTPDHGLVAVGSIAPIAGDLNAYLLKTDSKLRLFNPDSTGAGCVTQDFVPVIVQPVTSAVAAVSVANDVSLTMTDYAATNMPARLPVTDYCGNPSACTILTLSGKDSVCSLKDTLVYKALRDTGCTLPLQWTIDPSRAKIVAVSDSSVSILFIKAGAVTLYGRIGTNCKIVQASLPVFVAGSPDSVNLGPDITLCRQSIIRLSAGSGFKLYQWQDGSVDSVFTAWLPGTYFVTATDYCGRQYGDTVLVTQGPDIPFSLGPDVQKCNTDTITLTAPAGFSSYYWSPAYRTNSVYGQSVQAAPVKDTVYVCTALKYPGCTVVDSIAVKVVLSAPVHLGNDTSFCAGGSVVLDAGSGFRSYAWNTGAIGQEIIATQAGGYWVAATDSNHCVSKDTLVVQQVYPLPSGFLTAAADICINQSLQLQSVGDWAAYKWFDNSTGAGTTVTAPGQYWLQVTDTHGCGATDTVVVTAKDCKRGIFFPNAFSPGSGGANASYKPVIYGPLPDLFNMVIYNRAGEQVYQTRDPSKGWDGSYKGLRQSTNTFVWYCTYKFPGEAEKTAKGFVILVR